jgi:hypothetical protein
VIREVRGQCTAVGKQSDHRKPERAAVAPAIGPPLEDEESDVTAALADAATDDESGFVDGVEQEHRHLSKAERKRLKKLARMNRSAA